MARPILVLPTAPAKAPMPTVNATEGARPTPAVEPPYLGAQVIVKTSENIAGQNEHIAIVTKVLRGDLVNVLLMPGEGQPYPIASIYRESGAPSWRWPSRN